MKAELKTRDLWLRLAVSLAAVVALWGCGGAGEKAGAGCSLCGDRANILGSITSQFGGQAQMQGWVMVAIERDTNVARVGEVDAAGLFQFKQLRVDQAQTLVLLSPDYIVQSVLSIPGTVPGTVRQFITVRDVNLPRLIHQGPIMTFQDTVGVNILNDLASDVDGDLIPDGSVSIGAQAVALQGSTVDLDLDGIPNERDADMDGDGVTNIIDPDDDGDAILDVFDGDSNGDLENDLAPGQEDTDPYFDLGVEFVAVQYELRPKTDGTGNESTLSFTTKVRDNTTPLAVQIRGAPTLLQGALENTVDVDGNAAQVAWNRLLGDDGVSNDSSPDDRLFAERVVLENAKAPRAHEVVFFQLVFGTAEDPWFLEFPYTFPDVRPATISAQYEVNSRRVLLVGNPFGELQDFVWAINIYDENQMLVWTSQPVPGITRQFTVPDNATVAGATYTYSVVARTLDKVLGYPGYTIHSAQANMQ